MAVGPFIGHAPRASRERPFLTLPFPSPQASGPGPKPSECPHRLSTSAAAACAARRGSSGPGWDWAPEKPKLRALPSQDPWEPWPLMLGPGLASPWTPCTLIASPSAFANGCPPPIACTTGVEGSLLSGSREMGTDTCNGLKHPAHPRTQLIFLAEYCFLHLHSAVAELGLVRACRDAHWKCSG